MEDWEEERESMKNDINQLKDQVGQILESIVSLKSMMSTRNEEAQSSHPPVLQSGALQMQNQGNRTNQEWPPYGLPLNYEPPYEEVVGQPPVINTPLKGQNPAIINTPLAKGQEPLTGHVEKVVINKIPSTTQQPTSEPLKVDIHEGIQNALINADKMKDKLEILE